MINKFKKNPLDGGGKRPPNRQTIESKNQHESHDADTSFESDDDRESREYTIFSMYSTYNNSADESLVMRNSDINYERSESMAQSKKKVFQNSVHKVIQLQALVQKLKSFNSKVVKATLIQMVPLINNPETAVVLKEAGLCTLLLDLLKFDPLSHWSIVGLSLQALLSVVSIPECALAVISLPNFPSTIESFLKSDKALTQIIAGRIVHCCFVQPIQHEWRVVQDRNMLSLLFKAMELPYKDVQISLLNVLEDLTYHCDNTLQLCVYGESIEVDFLQLIAGLIISEENAEMRLRAMRIYLNALSAIHFDQTIERTVILHAFTVETALMKHMQSLQRTKAHRISARTSGTALIRGSKLSTLERNSGRDLTSEAERPSMGRRSSMRMKAVKFGSELDDDAKKKLDTGDKEGAEGGAGALLQVTEEITILAEILWLIRSSGMFRRLVNHRKRTNLVAPRDSMADLITSL
mmetsp:Transcript_26182/g.44145  ORF Transcript_26182/g.44145 Transcript_26182/m.44145 type:complete len:466 (-) Transcript_26182:67-1464(-)